MSGFDLLVGIDYSGAKTPTWRIKELQVYAAKPGGVHGWQPPDAKSVIAEVYPSNTTSPLPAPSLMHGAGVAIRTGSL